MAKQQAVVVDDRVAAQAIADKLGVHPDAAGNVHVGDPGRAPGRARDPQYEARYASLRNRLSKTGVQPASVLNFLPFHININAAMPSTRGGVRAPKTGERFAFRTWTEPDIQVMDRGELGKEPTDFHPIQIAEAFAFDYPHGGVLVIPGAEKDFEKFEDLIKREESRAIQVMQDFIASGDRKWTQKVLVDIPEKHAAQRLFELKIIQVLPVWVNQKRQLTDIPAACKRCGKTPENRHAVQCTCGYILDPKEAFERHVITEEDESLERLTRAEVVELGISDYVAETADERPARLKAGLVKPIARAAERVFEAEEKLKRSDKK